jgi:hypothetical protein
MGNKDKAKREVKKQPKPKLKVEPGRRRDDGGQTVARIVNKDTTKD